MRYAGLFPILHTPFDADGEVDFDSFRRLVGYVRDAGVKGVVFPGFASEWWRLTDDEILECACCIGRTFIGVVTPQATKPALRRMRELEAAGAGGLMLLPPFLLSAPGSEHLDTLLGATSLPCILQDSAGLTGTRLDARALSRLAAAHRNFAGIKVDQVPTGPAISALREDPVLRELSYFAGYSGVQWFDAERRGATGLMSGCGHIAQDRLMLGNPAAYRRLLPLLNFEMQTLDMVIGVHKQLLFEKGIIATPELRAPSARLDAAHLEELRLLMAGLA